MKMQLRCLFTGLFTSLLSAHVYAQEEPPEPPPPPPTCAFNDPSNYCNISGYTNARRNVCQGHTVVPLPSMADTAGFLYGQCTSYVAFRMNCQDINCAISNGSFAWDTANGLGDAETWAASFIANGQYAVDRFPRVGDIAVWNQGPSGHVAQVSKVNPDGTVQYSEFNGLHPCEYSSRDNDVADYYIHYPNVFNLAPPDNPPPPAFVTAAAKTDGVRLVWLNRTELTNSVRIRRQQNNEDLTLLATLSGGNTWFLDTTASGGNTYTYWVENEASPGSWISSVASDTVTMPGKPENVDISYTRIADGQIQVVLKWNGAAQIGGLPVEYVVERDVALNGGWEPRITLTAAPGNAQEWIDIVDGNRKPRYRVYAKIGTALSATVMAGKPGFTIPLMSWDSTNMYSTLAIVNESDEANTITINWRNASGSVPAAPVVASEVVTLLPHQRIMRAKPVGAGGRTSYSISVESNSGLPVSGTMLAEKYADKVHGIGWKSYWSIEGVETPGTEYALGQVYAASDLWESMLVMNNPDSFKTIEVSLEFPRMTSCNQTGANTVKIGALGTVTMTMSKLLRPGTSGGTRCFAYYSPEGWTGAVTLKAKFLASSEAAPVLVSYQHQRSNPGWTNVSIAASSLSAAGQTDGVLFAPILQNWGDWKNRVAIAANHGGGDANFKYSGPAYTNCGTENYELPIRFEPTILETQAGCKGAWGIFNTYSRYTGVFAAVSQTLRHDHPLVGTEYEYKLPTEESRHSDNVADYMAQSSGARRVIVPYLKNMAPSQANGNTPLIFYGASGIAIQSTMEKNEVHVAVKFYDENGGLLLPVQRHALKPHGTKVLVSSLLGGTIPDDAASAIIETEDNGSPVAQLPGYGIVATVNIMAMSSCADCLMSYSATQRK